MPDQKEQMTEQANTLAVSTVAALKSTPVVLALVIFNVLFMGLGTYLAIQTGDRYERLISAALQNCPAAPRGER